MTIKLAVFDLDGTLLRGDTVCLTIARSLGTYERMVEFERARNREEALVARSEMAGWYMDAGEAALLESLEDVELAPGAAACIDTLRSHGIELAIVSLTWGFAVRQIAGRLGIERVISTDLDFSSGEVTHVFGAEKGTRTKGIMEAIRVSADETAAVGDTPGDYSMLEVVAHRYYVGPEPPELGGCEHLPNADMREVARLIVEA